MQGSKVLIGKVCIQQVWAWQILELFFSQDTRKKNENNNNAQTEN